MTALVPVIVGGLLTVFSMWWVYFDRPAHDLLTSLRRAFLWGYGHFLLFGSAAAVGAGLAAAVDQASGRSAIGAVAAGYAVSVPVTLFILSLWVIHYRPEHRPTVWIAPAAAVLLLVAPLFVQGVLATGVILVGAIVVKHYRRGYQPPRFTGAVHPGGASGHSSAGATGAR